MATKCMTTYIPFHCIELLCPKQLVGYTAAFLYACLPKFLCAHLESQLVGTKWTTEMPSIHTSS